MNLSENLIKLQSNKSERWTTNTTLQALGGVAVTITNVRRYNLKTFVIKKVKSFHIRR